MTRLPAILIIGLFITGCLYDSDLIGAAHDDDPPLTDAGTDGSTGPTDPICGNGDTEPGEQCDDGNWENGDGCDTDCTFSCTSDLECHIDSLCTIDSCDLETHECIHDPVDCTDSDPCTWDHCSDHAGCINQYTGPWYRDEDRDCWGLEDETICGLESIPSGYTGQPGDCCDTENDANPSQRDYFSSPYNCDYTIEPTHDYNCDGNEEPQWTEVGSCTPSGGCSAAEGWVGSPPDCGVEGRWLTECRFDSESGACAPHFDIARIQRCR
jgi:cysteine-rich repeat protein